MVAISLYSLVNTFWVARLGYQAVAAITAVLPFFFLTVAVAVGTGVGINAFSSRKFGEKDSEAPNLAAGQALFLSVILGLLFALISNIFPDQILRLSGATQEVMDLAEGYLRAIGLGMPTFFFSLIIRNVFHASGDTSVQWFLRSLLKF